ncbi:MAG: hypothetical protein B6I25_07210 [Planctomycetales bacterium 4572_13]|nr:MAG: hypothetical protein B6I25_07210 [Planctomycetales bacterium 4572_13]
MLKTLRVTSLVAVILAAVGVIAIVVLGLKGDSQIKDFLAKQGVVDQLRGKSGQEGTQEDKSSPLVALARAVALRFDPPPPPKPVATGKPPAQTARAKPRRPVIPQPKVQTSTKFDLLATVVYETAPEKSLALLKTTANKQEWFRQGEKAGYLEIDEIRDGSVVFTQGGTKPQEIFVPAKPQMKSLLKDDRPVSTTGSSSITGRLPDADAASAHKAVTSETTDSGKVRIARPRPDSAARSQRVRSIPPPPSPQEQKKSLNKTMSGIEAIMNRRDDAVSGKGRKEENEMWMRLLTELNAEKKRLDTAAVDEEPSEKVAEKTEAAQPKESTEKKPQDTDKPAPAAGN